MKKHIFAVLSLFLVDNVCAVNDYCESDDDSCFFGDLTELSPLLPSPSLMLLPTPYEFKPKSELQVVHTADAQPFEETHLGQVPSDVLKVIFAELDAKELALASMVCKEFKSIVTAVAKKKIEQYQIKIDILRPLHKSKVTNCSQSFVIPAEAGIQENQGSGPLPSQGRHGAFERESSLCGGPNLYLTQGTPICRQLYEYETTYSFLACGFAIKEMNEIRTNMSLQEVPNQLIPAILHSLPRFGIIDVANITSEKSYSSIREFSIDSTILSSIGTFKNASIGQIETIAKISDKILIRQGDELPMKCFSNRSYLKHLLDNNPTRDAILNKCRLLWALAEKKDGYELNATGRIIETVFSGDYDAMKLCLESFGKIGEKEIGFMMVDIKGIKDLNQVSEMLKNFKQ